MTEYPFAKDEKAASYCNDIANEMTQLFGISIDESKARIEKHWSHVELQGEDDVVYHEDPEYWANTIYWGKDSSWWITGDERIRMNLPPLKPLGLDD